MIQLFKPHYFDFLWTGTRRISKTKMVDEFGQVFTEFEFENRLGVKCGVNSGSEFPLSVHMTKEFTFETSTVDSR